MLLFGGIFMHAMCCKQVASVASSPTAEGAAKIHFVPFLLGSDSGAALIAQQYFF
jgi:hypothetical protein